MAMWSISSVNGVKNGQEGDWITLEQIQGEQTLLINNVFGISARIILTGNEIYKLSQIQINPINEYRTMFRNENINIEEVYEMIKDEMDGRELTRSDVEELMYGIIQAIPTMLGKEDKNNGTNKENDFKDLSAFNLMRDLEFMESQMSFQNDKEILETLEVLYGCGEQESGMGMADKFIYQKYKNRVEKAFKEQKTGAERIVDFMKENGLTSNDLAIALAMVQATQLEVNKTEEYIINSEQKDNLRESDINR